MSRRGRGGRAGGGGWGGGFGIFLGFELGFQFAHLLGEAALLVGKFAAPFFYRVIGIAAKFPGGHVVNVPGCRWLGMVAGGNRGIRRSAW